METYNLRKTERERKERERERVVVVKRKEINKIIFSRHE